MTEGSGILQDWDANPRDPKILLIVVMFRLAQKASRLPGYLAPITVLYLCLYRVLVEWLLSVYLHWDTEVGPRLRLYHAFGLVVHASTVIGADCALRHGVTLGTLDRAGDDSGQAPTLGNGVEVGANAVVLGPITIGDGALIGAGAVVTQDVPARAVVVGNPAKIVRYLDDERPSGPRLVEEGQ